MPVSNNFRRMMAQVSTNKKSGITPLCLVARASTSNKPTFKQAMNGPGAGDLEMPLMQRWDI
eukprot:11431787-Ditylum_brightwellii.AAC.2